MAELAELAESAGGADWFEALQVAALFALDPCSFGGIAVRAPAGPARDAWLESLRALLPEGPWRRMPANISEGRLLGGLDLAASLKAGRPVVEKGLLAEVDGGVLVLAMAERIPAATIAHLTAVLDAGQVIAERDGMSLRLAARIGVVALDEGLGEDEHAALSLVDRMAFQLDLSGLRWQPQAQLDDSAPLEPLVTVDALALARRRLALVAMSDALMTALASTALALGIGSLRPTLMAIRAARACAALDGSDAVSESHAKRAAQLVLAPRARQLPSSGEDAPGPEREESPESGDPKDEATGEPEDAATPASPSGATPPQAPAPEVGPDPAPEPAPDPDPNAQSDAPSPESLLEEVILAAAQAAIPSGLLDLLKGQARAMPQGRMSGQSGALQQSGLRGRPTGVRAGAPARGAHLSLVETLRAAAPWQEVRRRARAAEPSEGRPGAAPSRRIEVRADDFRVLRYVQRAQTTTIFVVDASGSSALHRLAEAKGAVELLLADCYVRRDRVAVLSFRGRTAELLLPPTRSLVRAKRSLAGLPGGGGTPLAAGLDAAFLLADGLRRRGETPSVVLLTDGRANVARDGGPGRSRATEDALVAARRLRSGGFPSVLLDTSPRAQPLAEDLARAMGARYLLLPYANAKALSTAVRSALAPASPRTP